MERENDKNGGDKEKIREGEKMQNLLGLGVTKTFQIFMSKFMGGIGNFILTLIYQIFKAIVLIVEFVENLFKSLAGINSITYNSSTYGGFGTSETASEGKYFDLLYAFLRDSTVQTTFFTILGFSVVLLVILTIVALVKTEFTMDVGAAAKGPILARSFKALLQFFIVPVFILLGVIASNALTRVVYTLTVQDTSTVASYCFSVGAYSANRARNDAQFARFLYEGYYMKNGGGDGQKKNPFSVTEDQEKIAQLVDAFMSGRDSEVDSNLLQECSVRITTTSNGKKYAVYYINRIDFYEYSLDDMWDMWDNGKVPSGVENGNTGFGTVNNNANFWKESSGDKYYAPWQTYIVGTPKILSVDKAQQSPYMDATLVNYFYDLTKFDYILAIGCGAILAWNFLTVCLAMLKRVFEMVILFLMSPAIIAMAPLDGGGAFGKWKSNVYSRLFAVIGPLFAYNIFFVFVPLIDGINVFGSASGLTSVISKLFDIFFHTIAIIVAAGLMKTTSKFISDMLGIKDLMAEGGGMMGDATKTVKRGAMMTAGALGGAIGMAGKAATGAVKGTAAMLRTGYRKASGKYGSEEANKLSENKKELKNLEKEMEGITLTGKADDPYSEEYKQYHEKKAKKAKMDVLKNENKELEKKISDGDVHLKGGKEGAKKVLDKAQANYDRIMKDPVSSDDDKKLAEMFLKNAQDEYDTFDKRDKEYNENHKHAASRTAKEFMGEKWAKAKKTGKNLWNGYENEYGDKVKGVKGVWNDAWKEVGQIVAPKGGWRTVASRFAGAMDPEHNPLLQFAENFVTPKGREGFYKSKREVELEKRVDAKKKEKEEKDARYKERAEQVMDLLKQYLVERLGNNKAEEYNSLLNKRKTALDMGDRATFEKVSADIKNFEKKNGLDDLAKETKGKILKGDPAEQKAFEEHKAKLQAQAQRDALSKMKLDTSGGPLEVKMGSEETINTRIKDSEAFAKTLGEELGRSVDRKMSTTLQNVASGQEALLSWLRGIGSKLGATPSDGEDEKK